MPNNELIRFEEKFSMLLTANFDRLMSEIAALRVEFRMAAEVSEIAERLVSETHEESRRDRAELRAMIADLKAQLNGSPATALAPNR